MRYTFFFIKKIKLVVSKNGKTKIKCYNIKNSSTKTDC